MLCLCRSELSSVCGTFRISLTARFPADSSHSTLLSFVSDYVIDDKVAILQKRDHEGFGFVLRGAKGNGCGFWGVLPPPLPPFKAPPLLWLYVLVRNVLGYILFLAFPFLVGISTLGGTEVFLLRVNVGVHRGMSSGLVSLPAAYSTPGCYALVVRWLRGASRHDLGL